jgi:hypothetical protein
MKGKRPMTCDKCKDTGEISVVDEKNGVAKLRTEPCQDCCEHEFDSSEGYMCLNCNKEGAEDVFADAYDRWKASRYDD